MDQYGAYHEMQDDLTACATLDQVQLLSAKLDAQLKLEDYIVKFRAGEPRVVCCLDPAVPYGHRLRSCGTHNGCGTPPLAADTAIASSRPFIAVSAPHHPLPASPSAAARSCSRSGPASSVSASWGKWPQREGESHAGEGGAY